MIVVGIVAAVVLGGAAAGAEWLRRTVAADRLPPNDWAGVRTSWARKSDEAWYAAQRASAPSLKATAWIFGTASVGSIALCVAWTLGLIRDVDTWGTMLAVVAILPCLVVLLLCAKGARDAKRAVQALETQPSQRL